MSKLKMEALNCKKFWTFGFGASDLFVLGTCDLEFLCCRVRTPRGTLAFIFHSIYMIFK